MSVQEDEKIQPQKQGSRKVPLLILSMVFEMESTARSTSSVDMGNCEMNSGYCSF